jgi:hypothetical protein
MGQGASERYSLLPQVVGRTKLGKELTFRDLLLFNCCEMESVRKDSSHFGSQSFFQKEKGERKRGKFGCAPFSLLPFAFLLLPLKDLGFATQDHSWCAFIGETSNAYRLA